MDIRVEKHWWGYFLFDNKVAVAVVGSWADAVKALKRWNSGH